MASALYKFVVNPSDTPDLRKRAEDLTDEATEAAGLAGHGVYLRGSGCYLFLAGGDGVDDPLRALRDHGKTRAWLSGVAGMSTFNAEAPEPFAFERLLATGAVPAEEAQFFRLVIDEEDWGEVAAAFEGLTDAAVDALGVDGLEAWWKPPELVLRVNARSLEWLEAPVEALGGATLLAFLSRYTDLNPEAPERFGLKEIHHILDDRRAVGITRSPG